MRLSDGSTVQVPDSDDDRAALLLEMKIRQHWPACRGDQTALFYQVWAELPNWSWCTTHVCNIFAQAYWRVAGEFRRARLRALPKASGPR